MICALGAHNIFQCPLLSRVNPQDQIPQSTAKMNHVIGQKEKEKFRAN